MLIVTVGVYEFHYHLEVVERGLVAVGESPRISPIEHIGYVGVSIVYVFVSDKDRRIFGSGGMPSGEKETRGP